MLTLRNHLFVEMDGFKYIKEGINLLSDAPFSNQTNIFNIKSCEKCQSQ